MYYYIIIILQAICLYHVYKTRNNTYWYFIIIFLPAIGCLVYGVTHFLTKKNIEVAQNEIATTINPSKKIKDLEKKVVFSDTFQNRINLADALLDQLNFEMAEKEYLSALTNSHSDDYYGNSQLLKALYNLEKYINVIEIGEVLQTKKDFEKSRAQFLYGLSLSKVGDHQKAESILKKIDQRYSNYSERLELSKFYVENDQKNQALEILTEMQSEYVNLTKPNKKAHNATFKEVDQWVDKLQ